MELERSLGWGQPSGSPHVATASDSRVWTHKGSSPSRAAAWGSPTPSGSPTAQGTDRLHLYLQPLTGTRPEARALQLCDNTCASR